MAVLIFRVAIGLAEESLRRLGPGAEAEPKIAGHRPGTVTPSPARFLNVLDGARRSHGRAGWPPGCIHFHGAGGLTSTASFAEAASFTSVRVVQLQPIPEQRKTSPIKIRVKI